jgi:hypothetical protein
MDMGGLVHNYITKKYPKVNSQSLSLQTWKQVVESIPNLAIRGAVNKGFSFSQPGVNISRQFLQMLAKATIRDGASLLTDFQTFLGKMSDIIFSVAAGNQNYKVMTCTYLNYLDQTAWAAITTRPGWCLKR